MTVLGKILVFLNLVAAVAVAAFIVLVFAARTNWAVGYNEYKNRYAALEASTNAIKVESDERYAALDKQLKAIAAERDQAKTALDQANVAVKTEAEKVLVANQQLKTENATKVALEADLLRQKDDVLKLAGAVKDKDEQILKLVKDKNDLRDDAVRASIDSNRQKVRVEQLAGHLQELTRDNERLKKSGGTIDSGAVARENPPPAHVDGVIKQIDPTGLVTISIGSDAGLMKGHTLDVYRLSGSGDYLGLLRLTDVRANEAVGQLLKRSRTPVKLGDRVGTLSTKG